MVHRLSNLGILTLSALSYFGTIQCKFLVTQQRQLYNLMCTGVAALRSLPVTPAFSSLHINTVCINSSKTF